MTPSTARPSRGRRHKHTAVDPDGPELLGVEPSGWLEPAAPLSGESVQSPGIAWRPGVMALLAIGVVVVLVAIAVVSVASPRSGDEAAEPDAHSSLRHSQQDSVGNTDVGNNSVGNTDVGNNAADGGPTLGRDDEAAAVISVHVRYMTQLFNRDERELPPKAWLPLAEELATGRALANIQDRTDRRVSTGNSLVSPGYRSNIVSLEIDGDDAVIVDCSQDTGELFSVDGQLLVEADDFYKLRFSQLVRIEGRWFVEHLDTAGDEFCEPPA